MKNNAKLKKPSVTDTCLDTLFVNRSAESGQSNVTHFFVVAAENRRFLESIGFTIWLSINFIKSLIYLKWLKF
jgi:hypothetical protein